MITIVLADDHKVVRQGLRALLSAEPDLSVIGEAGDGLEAMKIVESLKPDVLVLDLMMTGINGLEVARQLHKRCPATGIVMLTMHSNEGYILEALRSGAKAYVLKESSTEEVVRAIREVAAGHRYLSPPLSQRAIEAYTWKSEVSTLDPYDSLTTREREVLQLTAQGYTYSQIAQRLFISPRTAETHRTNLMRKLGLHTQSQLIRYAIQRGVLPTDTAVPPE